jgi:hypothetical protein
VITVAWVLVLLSGAARFVDPDVWHSMALAREALALGHVPLTDRFAYTPTVTPVVHHEWGSGMLLYFLATHGGLIALQLVRALLIALLALGVLRVARERGATTGVLAALAPPALVMSWIGLTALRPQLVTLVFLAVWLHLIERDRRGDRGWIPLALVGTCQLNLHGGFCRGGLLRSTPREKPSSPSFRTSWRARARRPRGGQPYGLLTTVLVRAHDGPAEHRQWQPIWRAHPWLR